MNYLEHNLSSLAEREESSLREKLKQIEKLPVDIAITKARNGSPSLQSTKDNNKTWLLSGYNPEAEGTRWAEKAELARGSITVVVGFGLGYHLEALVERATTIDNALVIVVEPNLALLKKALQERNLEKLLSNKQFSLIAATSEAELHYELALKIRVGQFKDVNLLFFHPLFNHSEIYNNTLVQLKSFINNEYINRNTFVTKGYEWTENTLKNLPALIESTYLSSLYGAFTGIPAILVAAGPSLDKNIHLLKEAKGKALIVSVGTAYKPVLQSGTEPDLVFHIESTDYITKNLQKEIEASSLEQARLAYVPETNPLTPGIFKNNLFLGMSPYSMTWLKTLLGEVPQTLTSGPSVANYAFDFLVRTGANPIIFIGQDLAFSGEKTHASDTMQSNMVVKGKIADTVEVEGFDGSPVTTSKPIFTMLSWFNKYISSLPEDRVIVDATEGGAKIAGTEIITFKESLGRYCTNAVDIEAKINRHGRGPEIQTSHFYDVIIETIKECEEAQKMGRKAYQKSLDLQALVAGGNFAGNKLQKKYDEVMDMVNFIEEKKLYKEVCSLMFEVVNRVFDESRSMALREKKFTREYGIAVAKAYQYYFSQIIEMSQIATGFLEEHLKNRSFTGDLEKAL